MKTSLIKQGKSKYLEHYKKAVDKYWEFDKVIDNIAIENYFLAQAYQESRFNPLAKSPVGALGISQFMPNTALQIGNELKRDELFKNGFEPTNDIQSIYAQVYYMNKLYKNWTTKRLPLEKLELAFASYNAGLGNILQAQKVSGNKILWDNIKLSLHKVTGRNADETINYVDLIKNYSFAFSNIEA